MMKDIINTPKQDSPVEVVELNSKRVAVPFLVPSKGKLSGNNFDGNIRLLPMTASHLLMLLTPALYNNDLVFVNILKDCVLDLPFDVIELLTQDKDAIIMAIRAISYGNDHKITVECDSCGHEYITNVNLERDIKVDYLESDKLKMPIEIPKTLLNESKSVNLRYKTWRDNIAVSKTSEAQTSDSLDSSILDFLELVITEVEGIGKNSLDIREWLNGISAHDIGVLLSVANSEKFGINAEFTPEPCPKCGHVFKTIFRTDPSFFRATAPEAFLEGLY